MAPTNLTVTFYVMTETSLYIGVLGQTLRFKKIASTRQSKTRVGCELTGNRFMFKPDGLHGYLGLLSKLTAGIERTTPIIALFLDEKTARAHFQTLCTEYGTYHYWDRKLKRETSQTIQALLAHPQYGRLISFQDIREEFFDFEA